MLDNTFLNILYRRQNTLKRVYFGLDFLSLVGQLIHLSRVNFSHSKQLIKVKRVTHLFILIVEKHLPDIHVDTTGGHQLS